MSDISEHPFDLTPQRRALLELLLQEENVPPIPAASIPRRTHNDVIPASLAQERLWFLWKLEPTSAAYHISAAIRLDGELDVGALRAALTTLVARHESLRTHFTEMDGIAHQVIAAEAVYGWLEQDFSALPTAAREARVQAYLRHAAAEPFDLASGPLLRAELIRLAAHQHVLLLVMHHIISDGWSLGILVREFVVCYEAARAGRADDLPVLPIQYGDYAVWQRTWLDDGVLDAQLAYWRARLGDEQAVLELAADRVRTGPRHAAGGHVVRDVPAMLTAELRRLSQAHGATLSMTLLAAFNVLLYRYSGQPDMRVGVPVAGRQRLETEALVGFFVNTLVIRTELSAAMPFSELLAQVRARVLEAQANQDLPFAWLVEALRPVRSLRHTPLFQVMFNLQPAAGDALAHLPGLTVSGVESDAGMSQFDLTLDVTERPEELGLSFGYASDLFDHSTVERLVDQFIRLLEGIVVQPDGALSALPLLSGTERHRLLVEWNDTATAYPRQRCLHELFVEQAARTPHTMAVMYEGQQLTYAELDRRSNQLAHYLCALGVGPEVRVGLCLERSPEAVVGILGILKAGGTYVPLDPAYPKERLAFMLQDAQVAVLITQQRLRQQLPDCEAQVVCLETDGETMAQESAENLNSEVTAQHLAYVVYTSGSTGTPKGVMGLHQGAVNRLHWMWTHYPFEAEEVCCQKTSLNFVDSIWEIFGPLLRGIPTVIIPDAVLKDPHALVQTLAVNHITRIVLVPSLLRVMLETLSGLHTQVPRLKYWISSGEALSMELSQHFLETMPQSILLNLYGSSEVSADSTWYDTRESTALPSVPIGRPIANTRIYLLDRTLQPVPIGVPGELYIGGAGLARGYLNGPALTAERFVPNPFSDESGARQYKTGDLARYRPDGILEYGGRLDQQVKIRGFRVELGEIEAALSRHPGVRGTVVVAREDTTSDKRLVAYVMPTQASPLTTGQLRSFLRGKLPDYMVPAAFVLVDTLPLTPNGKIDRRALPTPVLVPETTYVAPRTPMEETVCRIWAKVLNLPQVGIQDHFFLLGGHSLLAVRAISRLSAELGQDIDLATLFHYPTVIELAHYLSAQTSSDDEHAVGLMNCWLEELMGAT
jgi:amino acid adenylation domain-containing protein